MSHWGCSLIGMTGWLGWLFWSGPVHVVFGGRRCHHSHISQQRLTRHSRLMISNPPGCLLRLLSTVVAGFRRASVVTLAHKNALSLWAYCTDVQLERASHMGRRRHLNLMSWISSLPHSSPKHGKLHNSSLFERFQFWDNLLYSMNWLIHH